MIKSAMTTKRIRGRNIVVVQTKTIHHLDVPIRVQKLPLASEIVLHRSVADLLAKTARRDIFWYHYPTGEFSDAKVVAELKAMGAVSGFADFGFILNGGRSAFLGLKRADGSVSKEQRAFRDKVVLLGCNYQVARNIDQVVDILSTWGVITLSGGHDAEA